jgi:HSP20 family protein
LVDESLKQVERLYRALVGSEPPTDAPHLEIPPEKDPGVFINTQIERLLGALGGQTPEQLQPSWTPATTISEETEAFVIDVDLAGVKRDDVHVTVSAGMLEITGVRNVQNGHQERHLRVSERPLGAFRRLLALPQDCNITSTSARLTDGVLSIRVPRTRAAEQAPRHIAIA